VFALNKKKLKAIDPHPYLIDLKRNSLIAVSVVVAIIGLVGGYYLGYQQLSTAADQMLKDATVVSTRLENVTLVPFRGDLRVTYSVRNPVAMNIVLNMDADLYYGDVYIGHVVSSNQAVAPSTRVDVVVKTAIEGDILRAVQQGSGKAWLLKDSMTFTGTALVFIPVTVTRKGELSTLVT
jgi:hypothetical protein